MCTCSAAQQPTLFPPLTLPPGYVLAPGASVALAGAPITITFHSEPVTLAPIEIYCRQCGHGNAANGMCFRCHPIRVERPR